MIVTRYPQLLVLLLLLVPLACANPVNAFQADEARSAFRTWSNNTGKFSVEAQLLAVEGDKVKIKKKDGRVIELPLGKLSEVDRAFIQGSQIEVSIEEAEQFAKEYLNAVEGNDTKKMRQLVSWDSVMERTFEGMPGSALLKGEFSKGTSAIVDSQPATINAAIKGGGNFSLLRATSRDGHRHVIFRLVTGDTTGNDEEGDVNYHDLRLIKIDGRVCAQDLYFSNSGSWISETLKDSWAPFIIDNKPNSKGKLTGSEKRTLERAKLCSQVLTTLKSGDNARTLQLYHALPKKCQKSKAMLMARMMAGDGDEYVAAAETLMSEYPDCGSIGVQLLTIGASKKKLSYVKRAQRQNAKWTGGDPYFDLLAANVMCDIGEAEEAIELTKPITAGQFEFETAVFLKLGVALMAKDKAAAIDSIRVLRDDFDQEFEFESEEEVYEAYLSSPDNK